MRHTPGPWIVNDFCAMNEADVMVWSGEDIHTAKPIAECAFVTQAEIDSGETGCHQLEAEANAKLIAAAPALLALAREYAGECAECGGGGEIVKNRGSGDPIDDYSVECADCRDIHAVIDVATGR
jgi:hypothetical protein